MSLQFISEGGARKEEVEEARATDGVSVAAAVGSLVSRRRRRKIADKKMISKNHEVEAAAALTMT